MVNAQRERDMVQKCAQREREIWYRNGPLTGLYTEILPGGGGGGGGGWGNLGYGKKTTIEAYVKLRM